MGKASEPIPTQAGGKSGQHWIYGICCLSVFRFGTHTGSVGIREADWQVHGLPNYNPGGRSRGDLSGWRQADRLPAGGRTLSVSAPVWIVTFDFTPILYRTASGLHFVCLFRESLGVFLFPPSSQHGTKTNYPSKFDSRTLERSQRPSQQPMGRSKKKAMANPLQLWMASPWRGMASGRHF